ncbi:MAG: hypothetical protein LBM07_08885 [Culturomica sp.]|nr:hypothetical protein [Culturomica sp.]
MLNIENFRRPKTSSKSVQQQPVGEKVAQPKVQKTVVSESTHRPTSSFRLKEAFAATVSEVQQSKHTTEVISAINLEAKDSFDITKLQKALHSYISDNHLDMTTSTAIVAHSPKIFAEDITIEVDNQMQFDRLETIKTDLRNYLVKTLNNGAIVCNIKMFENQAGVKEDKKPFTSQEKWEHLLKQNPLVADMKNMFGLEFE